MRPTSIAATAAAATIGASLLPCTSAAGSNATVAATSNISKLYPSETTSVDQIFERGRGGSNKTKTNGAAATTTAISTSTSKAVTTKTTKTTTKTSEATQTPSSHAEIAASAFYGFVNNETSTNCPEKRDCKAAGENLIHNAGSVDYPNWPTQLADRMSQSMNLTACPKESWNGTSEERGDMTTTIEELRAGLVNTTE